MKALVLGVFACVALAACGNGSSTKGATQLAAKVNGSEISVHLVNAQLARLGTVPEDQRQAATKRILEGLIDQQLLVDQAMDKKLDRDPEVLAAIEAARHQILAQAYLQKALGAKAQVSDDEVKKYYADNAPLFGDRKVYRLREVSARVPANQMEAFKAMAGKLKAIAEAAPWLRDNKIEFTANEAVRPAERLPMNSLKRLSQMKDGEIGIFEGDNGSVSLLQLMAAQSAPVSEKDAAPSIQQYLTTTRREQIARDELKRLRDTAKLEYVGDYAKLQPSAAPVANAAPAATPAATAAPAATNTAAPGSVSQGAAPAAAAPAAQAGAGSLDKGVAGLR